MLTMNDEAHSPPLQVLDDTYDLGRIMKTSLEKKGAKT